MTCHGWTQRLLLSSLLGHWLLADRTSVPPIKPVALIIKGSLPEQVEEENRGETTYSQVCTENGRQNGTENK